jgi:hypothetical protein
MSLIVVTNGTNLTFPGDGTGTGTAIRGTASSATVTYTATTATDTAAGIPGAGTLPGDFVFLPGGIWGVVQSYSGAANNTVVTVDRWRKANLTDPPPQLVPPVNSVFTIHSPCGVAGFGPLTLQKIDIINPGAAGATLLIKDVSGTTLVTVTTGAQAVNWVIDFGDDARDGGWDWKTPFSLQATGALVAMAVYKPSGRAG